MARPSTGANLNIAQLEQILTERRSSLIRLEKQRKKLLHDLDVVDREIARIGGNGAAGPRLATGARARNDKSLPEALAEVLTEAGRPMKIAEIADAVQAAGYRSTSDNFRAIVNQTLIKERKRFAPGPERGTYQIKK